MLNDSKWIETGETVFELRTSEDILIATLSYNECNNAWQIDIENVLNELRENVLFIASSTKDEAKWRATVEIYNYCNGIIRYSMKIRDHLPDISELYSKAKGSD